MQRQRSDTPFPLTNNNRNGNNRNGGLLPPPALPPRRLSRFSPAALKAWFTPRRTVYVVSALLLVITIVVVAAVAAAKANQNRRKKDREPPVAPRMEPPVVRDPPLKDVNSSCVQTVTSPSLDSAAVKSIVKEVLAEMPPVVPTHMQPVAYRIKTPVRAFTVTQPTYVPNKPKNPMGWSS